MPSPTKMTAKNRRKTGSARRSLFYTMQFYWTFCARYAIILRAIRQDIVQALLRGALCRGAKTMLELQHISFVAADGDTNKEILDDVSFRVEEPFVAITGPNGSGKSTLAKIIAGILTPSEGRILLDGEDITALSVTDRARRGISYAFQQPVRFKGLTVKDLVSLAAGKRLTVSEVCSYLSEVGLCARDYIDREVNASLSGGELKRIEIATVLAREKRLTVFDEPEAGIDLWSFQSLITVFEKMHERTKGNILIISHQERILNIADRIIVIANGKVQKNGSREEVLPGLLASRACPVLAK